MHDFAGFDRRTENNLWLVRVKDTPEHKVYAFAQSWYEARRAAQRFFHHSFDAFTGEIIRSDALIPAGNYVTFSHRENGKPTGDVVAFRAIYDVHADAQEISLALEAL